GSRGSGRQGAAEAHRNGGAAVAHPGGSRMKRQPFERRGPRWWAASVAIHIVAIAALASIVFRYPLGQLMGLTEPELNTERIQYVKLPAPPTENSGGRRAPTPVEKAAPAALRAPTEVPTAVPVAQPTDSSPAKAAGGTGSGLGVSGSGYATGIEPRQPDKRIDLEAGPVARTPRTTAET